MSCSGLVEREDHDLGRAAVGQVVAERPVQAAAHLQQRLVALDEALVEERRLPADQNFAENGRSEVVRRSGPGSSNPGRAPGPERRRRSG